MRLCISASKFGPVTMMVHDFKVSPIPWSFHVSHRPATVIGWPFDAASFVRPMLPLSFSVLPA
jgi:hypothetical protein